MNRQELVNFAQTSQPSFKVDDDYHLAEATSDILIRLEEEGPIEPVYCWLQTLIRASPRHRGSVLEAPSSGSAHFPFP